MTEQTTLNFQEINQRLLSNALRHLIEWLPGGRKQGNEYVCASLQGGKGRSCSVNLNTGTWADFETDDKGGDLVSLYAAIRGLSQTEAARELEPHNPEILPSYSLKSYGKPTQTWPYHDPHGAEVCVIARYDTPDGKQFRGWTPDPDKPHKWQCKHLPAPRPLYRLPYIIGSNKPILIVEGEKTADAAQEIAGSIYEATTWINGSKSVNKTDWTPVYGRHVLIIPDNDEAGQKAAQAIISIILQYCPSVKLVDPAGMPDGWDLADARGWTYDELKNWCLNRVTNVTELAKPISQATPPASVVNQDIKLLNVNAPGPDDVPQNQSMFSLWESLGIPVNNNGFPINNIVTVQTILDYDTRWRDRIWYDVFYNALFFHQNGSLEPTLYDSEQALTIQRELITDYGLHRIDRTTVRDAIIEYAKQRVRCEPQDWLATLTWDGVPRIGNFTHKYLGTPDDSYHSAVSIYFWVGLIARIINPGCKLDCMVVLKGSQGTFKSTALDIIGGRWYAESCNQVGTKDFLQALHGKLIVEIGELDSFRRSTIQAIKNMLSTRIDYFRVPYAELPRPFPRQCILVGTTNDDDFLGDPTGARRFYPISTGYIDIQALLADRDQLYAEARELYKTGIEWYNIPATLSEPHQEAHRITDPWEEAINLESIRAAGLDTIRGFTTLEVCLRVLHISNDKINRVVSLRICDCLRKAGFTRGFISDKSGKSTRVWRRNLDTHLPENEDFDTHKKYENYQSTLDTYDIQDWDE